MTVLVRIFDTVHGSRFSFYLAYSAHQNIEPSTNGNFVDHDPPAYDTIAYNNNIESAHTDRELRRDTNSYRSDVGSAVGHVRVETNPYHTGYDQTGYDDAPPKYTELPVSVTYPHSPERRIITSQVIILLHQHRISIDQIVHFPKRFPCIYTSQNLIRITQCKFPLQNIKISCKN